MALACVVVLAPAAPTKAAPPVQLNVTGSTLLYPLFKLWIADYVAANPGVTIVAKSTGSGEAIDAIITGRQHLGLSEAHFSDEQAEANPQIVNIPLAIGSQMVVYNIPELRGTALKLDGPTLAGIYSGTIEQWDAAPIAALNPGIKLPSQKIVPIRRSDPSGATFVFTQYLDFSTPSWHYNVGAEKTVAWPFVAGEISATGNDGMLQAAAATPYSVAYLGINEKDAAAKAGLGTAMLANQEGRFLLPTEETIGAAASVLDPRTPTDERLSLVFAPGPNSYPLINYEYAVVSTRQSDPAVAKALRDFLLWANSPLGGNTDKYLSAMHLIPLHDYIRAMSEAQIRKIH